jgi:hypothetical protein
MQTFKYLRIGYRLINIKLKGYKLMQASIEHIIVTQKVKRELERRKQILSKKMGRKVSFDFVIRHLLGWS